MPNKSLCAQCGKPFKTNKHYSIYCSKLCLIFVFNKTKKRKNQGELFPLFKCECGNLFRLSFDPVFEDLDGLKLKDAKCAKCRVIK